MRHVLALACSLLLLNGHPQSGKAEFAAWGGHVVVGYVDEGGFINFSGPNVNLAKGRSKFALGMLPSLRFKRDEGPNRNSFVTPSLGAGFTYSHNMWSVQLPLYYKPKSAAAGGKWHPGIGVGVHLGGRARNGNERKQ